ncbi:MAG: hypothetical protein II453_11175 [Alphaproteobacteria bacterium]|nr:hypothetical protein [Alphaproteobacteria bacterium]
MKWKLTPKTGHIVPTLSAAKEISKALAPVGQIPNEWVTIETLRENAKICINYHSYLAIKFNGKWRLLGIITNMQTIRKYLREPLVNFHDTWLRGLPIDNPKIN